MTRTCAATPPARRPGRQSLEHVEVKVEAGAAVVSCVVVDEVELRGEPSVNRLRLTQV